MKRLIAVLSGLLVLPAFAEVAPSYYYEDVMEYADADIVADDAADDTVADEIVDIEPATPVKNTAVSPRNAGARVASSRGVSNSASSTRTISARNNNTGRVVAARTSTTATRAAASRTAQTNNATRATAADNATKTVSARRSVPTTGTAARASIVQTDTVNTPLYTGRVGVRVNNATTRVPTIRMTTASTTASTTAVATSATDTSSIEELAEMTDFCKAQYQTCMDNFCNVLDDNQGRCSCSANLKNYEKTENALKQATEDLQDVAQKIQYIGLSSDEVETLFTQTAAELEMQKTSDNTQLKNDLDKIKNAIISVKSGSATSTDSGISMDLSGLLDFSISSTGFDLSSFLNTTSSTSSISNQRGEQLYKTASARCKASALNSCTTQGVDASVVTNAYDLEIDKQCIAYERSLTDSNDQMASTVRNAKSVLQKARLLVAQQKNSYDLRGCINALDTCMQDDFVCGSDYENCLDPSGKYIVDGKIVVGSTPGKSGDNAGALYTTWKYGGSNDKDKKDAWGASAETGTLSEYIEKTVTETSAQKPSTSMSEFLQYKIGYHKDNDGKNYGMCMSVLNKCQDVTYTGSGQNAKYNATNNVIKEYLQRTLVQIKSKQDTVLANYAESCISDITSCLAQNNYDADKNTCGSAVCSSENVAESTPKLSANNKLAINACLPTIRTCMSVNGVAGTPDDITLNANQWVVAITSK
ncbi:MAG TPA: hypothetical protein DD611_01110 [Alphaproteobacteria bacterium]|nr:hypothetical protein [Alphaproteobacteria bacterium]